MLQTLKILLFMVFTTLTWSCVKDDIGAAGRQQSGTVTVVLDLPGIHKITGYALEAEDENSISQIDVLVFSVDGGSDNFLYSVVGSNITDTGSAVNGNEKTFTVPIPVEEQNTIRLVVLANARDHLPASIAVGTSKETVLEDVIFDISGKWPANEVTTDFIPIPMWGESEAINGASPPSAISITMLRAMAKVDVGINFPIGSDVASGLGDIFKLAEVHVVNPLGSAFAAPFAANYEAATGQVTAPSIPPGASVIAGPPLAYNILPAGGDSLSMLNRIYLAEVPAAMSGSDPNATILIIGGKFNLQQQTTYYRVDFADAEGNFLPLLRNFRYKINITNVISPGAPTVNDAIQLAAASSGMTVEIIVENEGINNIAFNNQYMVGVSSDMVRVEEPSLIGEVLAMTTFAGGYSASSNSEWLTITEGATGAAGAATTLSFSALPNSGDTRTALITIVAGSLSKTVEVVQPSLAQFPNSYIISPGSNAVIPLYKVYGVWSEELGTGLSDNVTSAELVWQDEQDLISDVTVQYADQGKNAYLQVATGATEGNAVVSVSIDGATRWSWHIWVTDYHPDAGGSTHQYNGLTWMDRNLGATSNIEGEVSARGCFYQWGRKDPFPGSIEPQAAEAATRPMYDINNAAVTINIVSASVTPGTAVSSPLSFFTGNALNNNDWIQDPLTDLWSSSEGNKTVYDPCPAGWKMAAWNDGSPWSPFTAANFPWGNAGRTFNGIVYYPAAGFRQAATGGMVDVGIAGFYWTATHASLINEGNNMLLSEDELLLSADAAKGDGMTVRCVTDD